MRIQPGERRVRTVRLRDQVCDRQVICIHLRAEPAESRTPGDCHPRDRDELLGGRGGWERVRGGCHAMRGASGGT